MRRTLAVIAVLVAAGLLAAAGFALVDRPRVLLVGDSITGQYGSVVASQLRADGYRVTVRGYPGIGLLDHGSRLNVDPLLQADLRTSDPDIVVGEFVGDYGLANPPAPGVPLESPAYYTAWTQAVQGFERGVRRRNATLIWVIPPRPLRNPGASVHLAAIYAAQAASGIDVLNSDAVAEARGINATLNSPDGAHLNLVGVGFVAGLIRQRVHRDSVGTVQLRRVHGPLLILEAVTGVVLLMVAVAGLARPRSFLQ